MNSKFSFRNIALLHNTYFRTNWKREIGRFLIQMLITLLLCYLSQEATLFPIFIAICSVIAYASGCFHTIHSKTNSIHYLSLPACTIEKLASKIILSHIYVPILLIAATAMGYFIYYIYSDINLQSYNRELAGWIFAGLTTASTYMVGSLYCKKHPIITTTLISCGISLLACIITINVGKHFIENNLSEYLLPVYYGTWPINLSGLATYYIWGTIHILIMWVTAYFKLRETEA